MLAAAQQQHGAFGLDADVERVRKAAVVGDADDVRDRRDSAVDLAGADLQQAPAELGRECAAKLVLDARRAADDVERADGEDRGLERSRVRAAREEQESSADEQ